MHVLRQEGAEGMLSDALYWGGVLAIHFYSRRAAACSGPSQRRQASAFTVRSPRQVRGLRPATGEAYGTASARQKSGKRSAKEREVLGKAWQLSSHRTGKAATAPTLSGELCRTSGDDCGQRTPERWNACPNLGQSIAPTKHRTEVREGIARQGVVKRTSTHCRPEPPTCVAPNKGLRERRFGRQPR